MSELVQLPMVNLASNQNLAYWPLLPLRDLGAARWQAIWAKGFTISYMNVDNVNQ